MKGFLPKDGSLFFMNERIHFQSCQKGVVGRCGNMHEKGVLHHIMGKVIGFFPDMAVLLVNLGGHGETGELFMHGLGDEDAW